MRTQALSYALLTELMFNLLFFFDATSNNFGRRCRCFGSRAAEPAQQSSGLLSVAGRARLAACKYCTLPSLYAAISMKQVRFHF